MSYTIMNESGAARLPRAVAHALTYTGAVALGLAVSAPIEQAVAAQGDQSLETVIVTGSRIRRTDEGALPVQSITQAQIQSQGVTTSEQFLQTVSIAVQGNSNTVSASGSGVTSGGVSSVSLRGLGSQRTLVLIDGRRVAGGGTITDSTSVDINSIPLAALERVEVLKEGASSVYGSDAIAGVINFILRKNFQGADVNAYYGDSERGGGDVTKVSAVLGYGDIKSDRFNVMLVGSWQKEKPLFGRDRSFSRSSINVAAGNDGTSGNTFPANVASEDGTVDGNPNAPDCAPSVTDPFFSPGVCRYDPSPEVALFPEAERWSVYGTARYAFTPNITGYLEASYSSNWMEFTIQPVPLSDQFVLPPNNPLFNLAPYNGFATVLLTPTSPFYPTAFATGQSGATPDLLVRYRSVITGNRRWTDQINQPRFVLGIGGDSGGWNWDVAGLYSETKLTEDFKNGGPAYSQILPLLNSGQVNFFGDNTPDILAAADATQFRGRAYSTTTKIEGVAGSVSKDLAKLNAGPLALAFGLEYRKESFNTDPSAAIQSGDIASYGGNFFPIDRSRNVYAAFAELNIPIVQTLEANLAVRYDDYEGTGSKTVPKISARWKPLDWLLFRGSAGQGFRAPSLSELWQPQVTGVSGSGLNDPERCNVVDANGVLNQDSRDCATQFPITIGGNPNLKPEESDNYTLGVVFEPSADYSFGFDGFYIKLKETIIFGVNPTAILTDIGRFGDLVTRGPPEVATPGLPGRIINIDQVNLNFGETKVAGVDADFRARFDIGKAGALTASIVGTYFAKYEIQNPDGSFDSILGEVSPITNGAGGVIPRWHHYLTLGWNLGPWEATIAQNYQTSYHDLPGNATDPPITRDVASYLIHDAQVAYHLENWRFAVGARNFTDRDPPYTNAGGGLNFFQAGYDPGYADPRGRFWYGQLSYSFAGGK
ncbi:TonB-dependent receptor [Steroidobacter cummioxidans]|uniref:TonB-dependent receptor n=1 Tax=Steroidobacter cummioxidans TaxID=1803913 RepID=UPI000E315440|nr:TonB-dependent receptor [Steroidobacter cummioxidans]